MPRTLKDWLAFQLAGSRAEIVLGLERVRAVAAALELKSPATLVVSVAGTNGKGSTVAFLEAMARAGGHRVGAYTSPHLLRYNERIRIDGAEADDQQICAAFARIEQARIEADASLTYFEYGTLAALLLFGEAGLDLAILEVGLGGRLDAVNLIDADAAIVTSIDLDHQEWLGHDRETIAREKAGIFRRGAIAVVAERDPPAALQHRANEVGARVLAAGHDYDWTVDGSSWRWQSNGGRTLALPAPNLPGAAQFGNASGAIAALVGLSSRFPLADRAFADGVRDARLIGRLQLTRWQEREVLLDVAHNPQAARTLSDWLHTHYPGRGIVAVFGGLADKDTAAIVLALRVQIRHWFCGGLEAGAQRGLSGSALAARVDAAGGRASEHSTVLEALAAARDRSAPDELVVAFGSFFVVTAVLRELEVAHL